MAGQVLLGGSHDLEGVLEVAALPLGEVGGGEMIVRRLAQPRLSRLVVQAQVGHQLHGVEEVRGHAGVDDPGFSGGGQTATRGQRR